MATSTALRNKIIAGVGIAAMGGGALSIAVEMIEPLEGTVRVPYLDVVGVPTVCTGHTGPDIIMGKTYTDAECQALLNKDLRAVANQIDPLIERRIPDTTRAALYSFSYNVGAGAFRQSTLLKKIKAGDTVGACNELRRWTYAGGKQWKGLMNRREIEREVCLWGQK